MTKIPVLANVVVLGSGPVLSANLSNYASVAIWANADVFYALGNAAITANSANVSTNFFLPANATYEFNHRRYAGSLDAYGTSHISFVRAGANPVGVYITAYEQ